MIFDILNPFHWLRSILSFVLVVAIILLPGWKVIFSNKTVGQGIGSIIKNPIGITITASKISVSYYSTWFSKQAANQFEKIKKDALKSLEK
jgi:uncharacterized membrane protein (DUF485 family)